MRRTDLLDLFLAPDRTMMRALLASIASANQPGVVCGLAETEDGARVGLEILATPLAKGVLSGERLLGLIQPLGGEGLLGQRPIKRIRVTSLYPPLAKEPRGPTQRLRLVVNNNLN